MIKKNSLRLTAGAFSIFMAVMVAIFDFTRGFHLNKPPLEPSPVPLSVTQSPNAQDQCSTDDEKSTEDESLCEIDETLQVNRGDTISTVLTRAEIDINQISDVVEHLHKVFNPKELRPEHEVYITYQPVKEGACKKDLKALYIRPSIDCEIQVHRTQEGEFVARREKKELKHIIQVAKGTIQNSLYIDAGKQNVPPKILHEMIQAFSYDVDFQRGFHVGDSYGIMYDTYFDPQSLREEPGHLTFALLQLQDKSYKIYRFKNNRGIDGFYNAKGESNRKGLLRTPIDGARISSTFGNRRHPILGYTKMHKGVDFAAPTGTPIMAAGDGVVMKAKRWNAYGLYVLISHNKEFSTAYAHLSRFAKSIHRGSRVRQGQIIGYVGSTGRTTGPHLHHELLRYNKQINPNSVKMMPALKLTGKDLTQFKAHSADIENIFATYRREISNPDAVESEDLEIPEQASDALDQKVISDPVIVKDPPIGQE